MSGFSSTLRLPMDGMLLKVNELNVCEECDSF